MKEGQTDDSAAHNTSPDGALPDVGDRSLEYVSRRTFERSWTSLGIMAIAPPAILVLFYVGAITASMLGVRGIQFPPWIGLLFGLLIVVGVIVSIFCSCIAIIAGSAAPETKTDATLGMIALSIYAAAFVFCGAGMAILFFVERK